VHTSFEMPLKYSVRMCADSLPNVKGRTKVSVLTPSKQMQKSIRYHTAITLTMRPVLRLNFLTTLTTEYHIRREVSITKFVICLLRQKICSTNQFQ
jgi:hypothetical protein